ncbi:unnamed protein product [Cuscuta europaea]|uniref:BZIP domain-containing protein n=1 Tax=Cuscuta europaea TaxID=41803 RepID=A0A9P1E6H4_CUSEU|nr:unnamed protein product [Cuscuta europaea]
MASTSAAPSNPDRTHPSSSPTLHSYADQLHSDQGRGLGSMNMDEIIKSIYADSNTLADSCTSSGAASGSKTVDEVWREIVSGGGGSRDPEMTLEDFLTKAGAVREEDVRVPAILPSPPASADVTGGFTVDSMVNSSNCQFPVVMQNGPCGFGVEPPHLGFGNGVMAMGVNGGARGKRRATVEEIPLDKATQQKQRRMIKNRESAARSRERKQVQKQIFSVPICLQPIQKDYVSKFSNSERISQQHFSISIKTAGLHCGIRVPGCTIGGGQCKAFERRSRAEE